MGDKHRHRLKWIIVLSVVATIYLAGSVFAAREATPTQSDIGWARAHGFLAGQVEEEEKIRQADFLKMVMTIYEAGKQGVFVPPGAENHWAAAYYATAKQEGIIDCGCQIKPNMTLSVEEAAKFVVNAANMKSGIELVKIGDVIKWVPNFGNSDVQMTNGQAATMIRKMGELFDEKGLSSK